jgi:hypothetical protein
MSNNPYSNRVVKENSFETFADGDYIVDGIDQYFSLDQSTPPYPVFTTQGDQLVARFNLRLADRSKVGPPMSANRNQLIMLVKAFGGDVKGLPEENTTAFLLAVQDRANKGAQKQTANVKAKDNKSYVKYVTGTNPETERMYTWKFLKAVSLDGTEPVRFQEKESNSRNGGKYVSSRVIFLFQLVGDMYGRPTDYDGYVLRLYVTNPFGEVSQKVAERWDKFVSLFCPNMHPDTGNWVWTDDPEKSIYGINEVDNPLLVHVGEALKANRLAVFVYRKNKDGYDDTDILTWVLAEASDVIDRDKKAAEESAQPWQLAELVELLDEVVKEGVGVKAFVGTPKESNTILLDWTPEGLIWAKENLSRLWDEAKLPLFDTKRVIGKLSGGECAVLESVVRKAYNKEKKAVNAALTDEGSF